VNKIKIPHLPHDPGVYLMRDKAAQIVYIGKARDLKKRVASYFSKSHGGDSSKIQTLLQVVQHIDYVPTASEREALVLERRLILRFQPTFNTMWKDDKSYPYVVLTLNEDYPRLYLTRNKRKGTGSLYFGPYPSVGRVRQLLRWAWRKKLFPLRPCKLDIEEGKPLPYSKVKSCLYLHTGECPAPCLGRISSAQYKKMANKAQLFFEGRQEKLKKVWEKDMRTLSKSMQYEKAAEVRDHLQTLGHIQEKITIRQLNEDQLKTRVGETRSIQSLREALNLKVSPETIECFDISHIQGDEMVASMVSFLHGRPQRSQYRKFIIRSVKGIDDFKAMAEVVKRRYSRLVSEKKTLPDLVVIDGGKGQLSAALGALKEENISGMSLASLAKREEEIFLPGNSQPIRLEEDSPGLLLLRHIRDEAHRFAVTFHRQRKRKKLVARKIRRKIP